MKKLPLLGAVLGLSQLFATPAFSQVTVISDTSFDTSNYFRSSTGSLTGGATLRADLNSLNGAVNRNFTTVSLMDGEYIELRFTLSVDFGATGVLPNAANNVRFALGSNNTATQVTADTNSNSPFNNIYTSFVANFSSGTATTVRAQTNLIGDGSVNQQLTNVADGGTSPTLSTPSSNFSFDGTPTNFILRVTRNSSSEVSVLVSADDSVDSFSTTTTFSGLDTNVLNDFNVLSIGQGNSAFQEALVIDNLVVETTGTVIPEPSTAALLGLGAIVLGFRRRKLMVR